MPYLANLPPRTRLLGWQSPAQTDALLASASLLVLPSRAEVLPIAILEAMARAIPILATPVGALPEILIHNHNAWLVQPDQPEALAQALATLIASPETRARLGQAGLETWQASLTIAQTATALQALYQQAASRARPSAARQPSLAVP
jgi:glycosyltransferase involved in cell wall biosynthesis